MKQLNRFLQLAIIPIAIFAFQGVLAQCVTGSISTSGGDVCYGTSPGAIDATTASNGSGGTPSYDWYVSFDGGTSYSKVSPNASTEDYTPSAITDTVTYRRFVVFGPGCLGFTSNEITFIPRDTTDITTNPSNSTLCEGNNTSFSVTATGYNLSYQWQEDNGGGYSNITNGGVYSNATTSTLNLTGVTASMNGYNYRCVVSSGACPDKNSSAATLTVQTAPNVTVDPLAATTCVSANASFTIMATGTNLSYQWQEDNGGGFSNVTNGGVYSGATTNALTLTGVTAGMDGYLYRCEVTGTCTPADQSNSATLTVHTQPTVTADPSNQQLCEGTNTNFSVTATGSPLTYQWQENTGGGFSNLSNGGVYSNVTTAMMTITGATSGMDGYTYRCVVDNAGCTEDISNSASLDVQFAPGITANPSNQTICENTAISFSITATGDGITYQWQEDDGGGFTNVTNGGIYSGATTNSLSISSAGSGLNGYDYRCIVNGTCTPAATSSTATLTVFTNPSISSNPANSTICSGNNTSFSVTASGSSLTYQWQENNGGGFANISNGGVYSNATTSMLNLTGVGTGLDGYTYRCVVDNSACAAVNSTAATLTVQTSPVVATDPVDQNTCVGDNTSFTVSGTGGSLTYQWQEDNGGGYSNISNGGIYSGATTTTLSLSGVTIGMNGYDYRCVLTGSCVPAATSNSANLEVFSTPSVTGQPSNQTICEGTNANFSVTASGSSLTYQWQEDNGGGFSNLSNGGVYSGATTATLTITGATSGMNGYDYRCVVDNANCPSVNSNSAALTIQTAPTVSSSPSNSTVCVGGNTNFSATATGTSLTYQWQEDNGGGFSNLSNGGVYSNVTTSTMSITGAGSGLNGHQYRCVVSGTCSPAANSSAATLTVQTAPSISVSPSDQSTCVANNASFSVTASGSSITYQWQEDNGGGFSNISNGGVYSGATTTTLTITGATSGMNGYDYRCVVSNSNCPSATSASANLEVMSQPTVTVDPSDDGACSTSSASFSVTATGTSLTYQWQEDDGGGFANLSNGGIYSGVTTATLTLNPNLPGGIDGYDYRVVVDNSACAADISASANLSLLTAPSITGNPSNDAVCAGSNASFSITATGSSLTYQWQEDDGGGFANLSNGGVYSGVTTNSLSLTGVGAGLDGYNYRCVVDNGGCPTATSTSASLTVNQAPSFTAQPSGLSACSGDNISFTVTANGAGLSYQWQEDNGGGFSDLSNGGSYSNVTSASLSITGITSGFDGYNYRCVVSGTCTPSATSNSATLNVASSVSFSSQPSAAVICNGGNASFSTTASGGTVVYQWQEDNGGGFSNLSNGGVYSGVSTGTLSITGAGTAMNGYDYRCYVTSSCGGPITSNSVNLEVQTAPNITSNPGNKTQCLGTTLNLTVTASGSSLTYQWQENNGGGFSNITNGGNYSGATTANLAVANITAGMDGYTYRVVVDNAGCSSATSGTATLSVNTAPSISTNSGNQTICEAGNASFSVTASGSSLTYQWQENDGGGWNAVTNSGTYSGATTSSLTISNAGTVLDTYRYRVIVSGACNPSATSTSDTLFVLAAPNLTTQPNASTICDGGNTSFTVAATGDALSYQWQENDGSGFTNLSNGGIYSGVSTTTLSLTSAGTSIDGYAYRCVVDNSACTAVNSNNATLTVQTAPSVTTNPSAVTVCDGGIASFSVTAGGSSLTYQWQEDQGGGFTNLANGGIYSGVNSSSLSLTGVGTAQDGYNYRVVVDNSTCTAVNSSSASLTVQTAPSVTGQPSNSTICDGGNASFTVTASGSSIFYQWQENDGGGFTNISNGGIYSGATTATLSLTGAGTALSSYTYRCVVDNSACTAVNSNSATLTVQTAPSVSAAPSDASICDGGNTTFSVTASGTAITYQWQEDNGGGFSNLSNGGVYSGVTTATLSLTAAGSGMNGYDYRVVVDNSTCTAVNSASANLEVQTAPGVTTNPSSNTICDGGNSSFSLTATGSSLTYQWQEDNGGGFANVSNGGIYSGATSATLTLTGAGSGLDGNNYRCVVDNSACASTTSSSATLTVQTAPSVTANPSASTICENTNTSFSVTATGTALTYQWQEDQGGGFTDLTDGGVYSGTTTATLTLTSAGSGMDGYSYRAVVDNSTCTADISSSAGLTVQINPSVTVDPSNNTICDGSNASFSVTATGSSLTYQWQEDNGGGFANVSNGGIYSGATSANLTLTGAGTGLNGYLYRAVVDNSTCSAVTSNSASLTVQSIPTVTVDPSASTICAGSDTSFSVTATGSSLTYQWQEDQGGGFADLSNGGVYSGVTTSTLTLTAAGSGMDGYLYRAVVDNSSCSADISASATLTVQTAPTVTSSPTSVTECEANSTSFSVTATGTSLTYQWQEDQGGGFSNLSNGGIYAGTASTTLAISTLNTSMDAYQYRVVVSGACTPDATSSAATLTVQAQPTVTIDPSNASACPANSASFSITATGTALTYQWQEDQGGGYTNLSNGGIYSGATNTSLSISAVSSAMDGYNYRCVLSNATCADDISGTASLTILVAPSISSNPAASTICENGNTSFSITASGSSITYQWQEDAGSGFTNLSNGGVYSGATSATLTLTSAGTALSGNTYRCVVSGACTPDATSSSASLTIEAQPTVTADPTDGSQCEGLNTSFTITATGDNLNYQWQEDDGSGFADLSNGGQYSGAISTTLSITGLTASQDGYDYRCVVSNPSCTDDISASANLNILLESTPITAVSALTNPICEGASTTLSASGGSNGDGATIEWYSGPNGTGTNISSGSGPITVSSTDTTTYYVRREGTCNTTTDFTYTLNVTDKPVADFSTQATCEGQVTKMFDATTVVNDSIINYNWDLGDGSKSSQKNVTHIYSSTGVYDIQLIVSTSNGCKDTVEKSTTIFNQPTADFSVSAVCLNEASQFTDNSSIGGTATLSHSWDFGDGNGTSINQNPSYTYPSSGGYTIELTVTSSDGCVDSVSKSTTIYMLPVADFDVNDECLNDSVHFVNRSQISTGSIVSYDWDFGDGNTGTRTSPGHMYTGTGTYTAELIATSNRGCKDTFSNTVEVIELPTAAFSANSECVNSPVSFTNSSTSPTGSALSYSWDFDDGSSSTGSAPSHSYSAAGTYDVTLTTTSAEGCKASVTNQVTIYRLPVISFSSSTVCDGFATSFTNASSDPEGSGMTYIWRFGDGDTSLRVSPNHVYNGSGTYNVTLVGTSGNGCIDSADKPVTVRPVPTADFRVSNVCQIDSADFQNTSSINSGSLTSLWDFGNGNTSTLENPKEAYTADGTYRVKLKVTSNFGCEDSVTKALTVYPMPGTDFSFANVCDGEDVGFINLTAVTTGTRYIWSFGDGFGSNTSSPTHTYSGPGDYDVTLTATTVNGCQETSPVKTVTVHPRIELDFTAPSVCDNDTVIFTNLSSLSNGTATYGWSYGDGKGTVGLNTKYSYDTFGVYTATLYGTTDQGCLDSLKKSVEVYGQPTALFNAGSKCEGSFVEFINNSIVPGTGGVFYNWDFGDGFASNLISPKHQYSQTGTFNPELIVTTSSGCADTLTRVVNVWPNPQAEFKIFGNGSVEVNALCFGETANFSDVSTVNSGALINWEWSFGDGFSAIGARNVQHDYLQPGIYPVELKVTTDSGCVDVSAQRIEIYPSPNVQFSMRDTCEGFPIQFDNQTTIDKGAVSFIWNFGDGGRSTLRDPLYIYSEAGNYNVTLVGISTDGCSDTAGPEPVVIHAIPDATITSDIGVFEFCEGDSAVLSGPSDPDYSYFWSTGETTESITVKQGGNYELRVLSSFRCENTNSVNVTVFTRPLADAGDDASISKGYSTILEGSGGGNYLWSPGESLDDSLKQQPVATPETTTTYTLIVEDRNGCLDTAQVNVAVTEDYKLEPSIFFSPNGDGVNEVWEITNITTYPDCQVIVSDRNGKIILNEAGYDNNWGGTYNGNQLPPGAYHYVIICTNGITYKGTVSIIN